MTTNRTARTPGWLSRRPMGLAANPARVFRAALQHPLARWTHRLRGLFPLLRPLVPARAALVGVQAAWTTLAAWGQLAATRAEWRVPQAGAFAFRPRRTRSVRDAEGRGRAEPRARRTNDLPSPVTLREPDEWLTFAPDETAQAEAMPPGIEPVGLPPEWVEIASGEPRQESAPSREPEPFAADTTDTKARQGTPSARAVRRAVEPATAAQASEPRVHARVVARRSSTTEPVRAAPVQAGAERATEGQAVLARAQAPDLRWPYTLVQVQRAGEPVRGEYPPRVRAPVLALRGAARSHRVTEPSGVYASAAESGSVALSGGEREAPESERLGEPALAPTTLFPVAAEAAAAARQWAARAERGTIAGFSVPQDAPERMLTILPRTARQQTGTATPGRIEARRTEGEPARVVRPVIQRAAFLSAAEAVHPFALRAEPARADFETGTRALLPEQARDETRAPLPAQLAPTSISAEAQQAWPVLGFLPGLVDAPSRDTRKEPVAVQILRRMMPARAERVIAAVASLPALGPGEPVPAAIRAPLERLLGRDVGAARVYTSPLAGELGAQAFTSGSRVVFAPGRLDMTTPRGLALLGHELTHLGQPLAFKTETGDSGRGEDTREEEAQTQEARVQQILEQGWPRASEREVRRAARSLAAIAATGTGGAGGEPASPAGPMGANAPAENGATPGTAEALPTARITELPPAAPSGGGAAQSAPDLDKLAQQVYAVLKTRLRAERERHSVYGR